MKMIIWMTMKNNHTGWWLLPSCQSQHSPSKPCPSGCEPFISQGSDCSGAVCPRRPVLPAAPAILLVW